MKWLCVCMAVWALCTGTACAAETRGLSVVAKDPASGQSGEVRLYNKSYAVIIGIDHYKNLSPDRQLKNAVNDAKGVEATLRKHFRFDKIFAIHDEQATRDNIMRLLTSELPKTVGKEDALFIFWAGHGNQERTDDGELGYLIPYDGSSDGIYGNITMSQLKDDISRAIPAKHVFFAFDACYSGLLTSRSVDRKVTRNLEYLKDITKERVRQVLTAGSKGQEALDGGPRGHSVFTGRLIEVLEAAGDYVTANEIQAILKEKVYQDARARGHEQTPGFGTLYGGGDFVFIPSIEQKVLDNKAELARMEAELQEIERVARQSQDDRKRQETERQKRVLEARVKAEELKKNQLAEDQQRRLLEEQNSIALQVSKKEDEEKLARIKAELQRKKQQQPELKASNIESALAEIRRLNAQITESDKKTAPVREQILAVYARKAAELKALQRDEFEKESDFTARIQNDQKLLESRKQNELAQLDVETIALREEIKNLTEKEYTIESSQVQVDLGKYDVENGVFPVTLKSSQMTPVVIAMNGTIPLPIQQARSFKQQYESGLIRPQVQALPNGKIVTAALVNDAENYLMEYYNGEFITLVERKRREAPPPRPALPFTVNEDVWKVIENSDAYRNLPRSRPIKVSSQYESHLEYTGSKSKSLKSPDPAKVNGSIVIAPLNDRCFHMISSDLMGMESYSCGNYITLGTTKDGKAIANIDAIDELKGSLFPMKIGAQQSIKYKSAILVSQKSLYTVSVVCKVEDRGEAKTLNPKLTGAAWSVRCNSSNKIRDNLNTSLDYLDYYLEDLGVFMSTIGQMNTVMQENKFILPVPGTTTVFDAPGDYGSRATKTYSSYDWTVGD